MKERKMDSEELLAWVKDNVGIWNHGAEFEAKYAEYLVPAESGESEKQVRPIIVCLCGSTKFTEAYRAAAVAETLAGKIVLSIGCNMRTDPEFGNGQEWSLATEVLDRIKTKLDELHKRKIDLADEVMILNVGGYIGESTRSERSYAIAHGKTVRYLEPLL
jgi:hypothetical protein